MHTFRFPRALRATTLAVAMALALPLQAAEFVFEGELQEHGVPANGYFDLQLTPYADRHSALPLAAATEFPAVEVVDGRFRVSLDLPGTAEAPAIAVAVRSSGEKSAYSALPGRQQAKAGPIGVCWSTTGDEGVIPGTHFLGTTDANPLELRVGNQRGMLLSPTAGAPNVVLGGAQNMVAPGLQAATISGGGGPLAELANRVEGSGGTVSGGARHVASGIFSAIGGGFNNATSGAYAGIGGGENNSASGTHAAIAGGRANLSGGSRAFVGAGLSNSAAGSGAVVAGGAFNCAGGDFSFAGGLGAVVRASSQASNAQLGESCIGRQGNDSDGDEGTFVWADLTDGGSEFSSTGPNQFLVRATGGVAFNGNRVPGGSDLVVNSRGNGQNADLLLMSQGSASGINLAAVSDGTLFIARANLANPALPTYTDYARWSSTGQLRLFVDDPIKPTAGGFSAPSDARLKQHVAPLENALNRLLALRGSTFEYRKDAPEGFYAPGVQTGFIAQEVEKVFPEWVSTDPSGYKLVGIKGFEALAVEALRELQQQKDAEIETLQMQLDAQRDANAALEARLARLEAALNHRVR